MAGFFVHPRALVETEEIGERTRVWAFAHVMPGAVIGPDCNICDGAFIEGGVRVGRGVTVKNGVMLFEGVTIEDGVFLGPNAVFTNDLLPRSPRLETARARYGGRAWLSRTLVRTGASIGANATILCGTTIGAWAMAGAGAVVTRDVPPHALVVGSPARRVGWVCVCAERLERNAARCPVCDHAYAWHDGAPALLEPVALWP